MVSEKEDRATTTFFLQIVRDDGPGGPCDQGGPGGPGDLHGLVRLVVVIRVVG